MAKAGYKRKKHQPILNIIGVNIRKYRTAKGLSVVELSVLCDMEPKAIYNYEYSKVDISASSVAIIADALAMEPYKLMKED